MNDELQSTRPDRTEDAEDDEKERCRHKPTQHHRLSERNAADLLNLMLDRGYFHGDVDEPRGDLDQPDDDVDTMKRMQRDRKEWTVYSIDDSSCDLVPTSTSLSTSSFGRGFVTRGRLVDELEDTLEREGGRLSLSDAASSLCVDVAHVERAADALCLKKNDSTSTEAAAVQRVGAELITSGYLDGLAEEVNSRLESQSGEGRVSVSELATSVFRLPLAVTARALSERMGTHIRGTAKAVSHRGGGGVGGAAAAALGGMKEIVTQRYEEERIAELRGALLGATVPTPLEGLSASEEESVKSLCEKRVLPGEFRGAGGVGSCTATVASSVTYFPKVYIAWQRQGVDDFFANNGYITSQKCLAMGILASKMEGFVKTSFPDAICLPDSVINPTVVIGPVEAAILESLTSKSFVDIQLHLPDAISQRDVDMILNDHIIPNINEIGPDAPDCVVVLKNGEALFFSPGMVLHAREVILPLIDDYGKSRAEEIERGMSETTNSKTKKKKNTGINSEDGTSSVGKSTKSSSRRGGKKIREDTEGDAEQESAKKLSAKEKRRSRKAGATKHRGIDAEQLPSSYSSFPAGVVPLVLVAEKVAEEYPDLILIQESYGAASDAGEECPSWEDADENTTTGGDIKDRGGPLYEFCRRALLTDAFRERCERAVAAELEKIQSYKKGISVGSRKEGAAKARNIERAFEDPSCFTAACHLVQMLAKLPMSLLNHEGDKERELFSILEHDYLHGCAANFTRRMTEYCLFKNGVEDGIFYFEKLTASPGDSEETSDIPSFCSLVDIACNVFDPVYLRCVPDEGGKPRHPLPVLREVLPGNVGVSLARMWALCGGECYEGGTIVSDDGGEYIKRGDLKKWISCTEESCLSIVGLPFKVLDKKAEKQAMFARRRRLAELLESASDGKDVLEISIMLLYQQVKHLAVAGAEITTLLYILEKESKMPEPVSQKLRELAKSLHERGSAPDVLILTVKDCGLSRDISKHVVS